MNDAPQTVHKPDSTSANNEPDLWALAIGGGCVVFGFFEGFSKALFAGGCILICAILMAGIKQCINWLSNNVHETQE